MRAYHLDADGFRARELAAGELSSESVRVRVEAVCVEAQDLSRCASMAPGGGLVGTVVDSGDAASAFMGARVLVAPVQACGECAQCRRGMAPACSTRVVLGSDSHGGCAQEVIASGRWLTRLQAEVDIEGPLAALVAGPGLAAYALYCRAGVAPGDAVVLAGHGATKGILGALARARGAKLVSLEGSEDEGFLASELARLDISGRPQHIFVCDALDGERVLGSATPGSTISIYGSSGAIDFAQLRARDLTMLGMSYAHPDLMPELAAIVAKGELVLEPFAEIMSIEQLGAEDPERMQAQGKCVIATHPQ